MPLLPYQVLTQVRPCDRLEAAHEGQWESSRASLPVSHLPALMSLPATSPKGTTVMVGCGLECPRGALPTLPPQTLVLLRWCQNVHHPLWLCCCQRCRWLGRQGRGWAGGGGLASLRQLTRRSWGPTSVLRVPPPCPEPRPPCTLSPPPPHSSLMLGRKTATLAVGEVAPAPFGSWGN